MWFKIKSVLLTIVAFLIFILITAACSSNTINIPSKVQTDYHDRHIIVFIIPYHTKAVATFRGGQPYIVLDQDWFSGLSKEAQHFVYFHEVAHHKLGHFFVQREMYIVQREADCWAIKRLIRKYDFGEKEINKIYNFIIEDLGTSAHFGSGYERVDDLRSCIAN